MALAHRYKWLVAVLGVGLLIALSWPIYERWSIVRQLEPERFNALPSDQVAAPLRAALRHGLLTFRSTADIEAWLRQRPRVHDFTIGAQYQDLRFFRSLPPESQAWVVLASRLVLPTLPDGGVNLRNASRIRGLRFDHPSVAATITRNLRAQSTFANPLGDLGVVIELNPGDPALVEDARRALAEPIRDVGRLLLESAIVAPSDEARKALVRAGTDIVLAAPRGPHEDRLFTSYGSREEPVVEAIRQHRLRRAEADQCIDFDGGDLPQAPLEQVWTRRVSTEKDALCLWYGMSQGKALLVSHPEITLRLLTRYVREGDGWRRNFLIAELSRDLVARGRPMSANEQRYCEKNGPTACPWLVHPGVTRVVEKAVLGPQVNLRLRGRQYVLSFADPAFQKAWLARLSPGTISLGTDPAVNLAALATAAGIDNASITSALASEKPYFDCRAPAGSVRVWGKPADPARLFGVKCSALLPPLPHEGRARPREASDAEAASWFKRSATPYLLVDSRGARIVWAPWFHHSAYDEIVGVSDLDGDGWVEVVLAYCGHAPRDNCGPDSHTSEILELTPDGNFGPPMFDLN